MVVTAALMLSCAGTTALGVPQEDPWVLNQEDQLARARGEAALAEAREHENAGRWRSAADAFGTALTFLPGNREAQEGLGRARRMMNEGSTLGDTAEELERLRQQALAEFDNSVKIANNRLAQGDLNGSEREVLRAQIQLSRRRDILGPQEYESMQRRLDDLLQQISVAREEEDLRRQAEIQEEARAEQMERERAALQERQRFIDENLRRVRQLQQELKYKEALQVLDEILFVDELNTAALALRDVLLSNIQYQEYWEYNRQKEHGLNNLSIETMRSTIPPRPNLTGPGMRSTTGVMEYPEDWPQITLARSGETGFQMTPQDRLVAQKMTDTTLPIDFSGNTFEQTLAFLEQVSGLDIYVDWKALEFAGIDRGDEISLQLNDVNIETALSRVLDQVGDDIDRPQWDIQDGILVVSSEEQLRKRTLTIVYDIRDLLFEVPYFDNAPELDLDTALNQGNQGGFGGGGGGGGGGFGGGGGGFGGGGGGSGGGGSIFGDPGDAPERRSREELIEQIVSIIQENIDPEGWRDLGGETGSLQELNGNLIITNTPRNHQEIDGLLTQLREIRALQINIEGRFLEVNSDWFEQIGIDLDLYFNTNSGLFNQLRAVDPSAQLSDFFFADGRLRDPVLFGSIPTGVDQDGNAIVEDFVPFGSIFGSGSGTPVDVIDVADDIQYTVPPVGAPIRQTDGFSPIPFVQNSFSAVNELAELTTFGMSAAANPALVTGLSYLDDIQVDLLIEATQADNRSVVLTAPRLTLFNGQRSWVAVTTSTAFVSGLQAVTGDASGAFVPQVSTLSEGFVMDIEAVADARRRYVTMTVIASLAQNAGFRETSAAEFGGAAGGGGGVVGGGTAGEFSGGCRERSRSSPACRCCRRSRSSTASSRTG
jgi:uncharacterized membrane protein YgcG